MYETNPGSSLLDPFINTELMVQSKWIKSKFTLSISQPSLFHCNNHIPLNHLFPNKLLSKRIKQRGSETEVFHKKKRNKKRFVWREIFQFFFFIFDLCFNAYDSFRRKKQKQWDKIGDQKKKEWMKSKNSIFFFLGPTLFHSYYCNKTRWKKNL